MKFDFAHPTFGRNGAVAFPQKRTFRLAYRDPSGRDHSYDYSDEGMARRSETFYKLRGYTDVSVHEI